MGKEFVEGRGWLAVDFAGAVLLLAFAGWCVRIEALGIAVSVLALVVVMSTVRRGMLRREVVADEAAGLRVGSLALPWDAMRDLLEYPWDPGHPALCLLSWFAPQLFPCRALEIRYTYEGDAGVQAMRKCVVPPLRDSEDLTAMILKNAKRIAAFWDTPGGHRHTWDGDRSGIAGALASGAPLDYAYAVDLLRRHVEAGAAEAGELLASLAEGPPGVEGGPEGEAPADLALDPVWHPAVPEDWGRRSSNGSAASGPEVAGMTRGEAHHTKGKRKALAEYAVKLMQIRQRFAVEVRPPDEGRDAVLREAVLSRPWGESTNPEKLFYVLFGDAAVCVLTENQMAFPLKGDTMWERPYSDVAVREGVWRDKPVRRVLASILTFGVYPLVVPSRRAMAQFAVAEEEEWTWLGYVPRHRFDEELDAFQKVADILQEKGGTVITSDPGIQPFSDPGTGVSARLGTSLFDLLGAVLGSIS